MKTQNLSYTVRLVAKEGENPITGELLPESEETILVEAKNKITAKEEAFKQTKLSFRGQEVEIYINGELFADPRW